MSRLLLLLLAFALLLICSSMASAAIVEHTLVVKNLTVQRLCTRQVVTAVNGSVPGPTLVAREGDTMVVHVINKSSYNMTIHWHGIFQLLSAWADGPSMVTQCPIQPGQNYTYRFNVTDQEGTLWWHAHVSVHRTTVHGALIIRPKSGNKYPFPEPYREVPIILGEWWKSSVFDLESQSLASGGAPHVSDAYTINGLPGDLYNCSRETYKLQVRRGKTYLLRIINGAVNNQLFFRIANHSLRVVAVDGSYTTPYDTDVVVTGPGQTVDVLLTANQSARSYYMAASPYVTKVGAAFDNTTTRAVLFYYDTSSSSPIMPQMPPPNDTPTAHKFYSNITGLAGGPHWVPVPTKIDEHMFITVNLGLSACDVNTTCKGPLGQRFSASMNNQSFQLPTTLSMLQAFFSNVNGVYTTDFPDNPPLQFDYINSTLSLNTSLLFAPKSTSVKVLKYNATVEIVLQNSALITTENHPMHLHGFNFYVLAQGFGNYDPVNGPNKFNLVNPQVRNTIGVPVGGWAVIRFRANNPGNACFSNINLLLSLSDYIIPGLGTAGVWMFHCHLDVHMPWGLGMAFVVQNGATPSSILPPPPIDLPRC
ncbi:hypothetical protein K2173_000015 [Erythroxylum novogranatense]|uniref:Laccase n=1 Tax=Erythroxylum novogranatense TaxID=1862640 RepID=A0AAV8SNA2_9ROSI|nr:hypothetical protein K2173_000015 [Erythroxylum novogranatense]